MTFLGAGFIVGGRLLWISGLKDKKVFADENDTHPRAFGKVVLGLAGMALGVVSVGGGNKPFSAVMLSLQRDIFL